MTDNIDSFTTTFSMILQEQIKSIQNTVGAFLTAIEQITKLLSEAISNLSRDTFKQKGTTQNQEGMPSQPIGLLICKEANTSEVKNERSSSGLINSALGGIGSFLGGIFSGFFAPVTGVAVGAELILALKNATPLVAEIRKLLADVKDSILLFISSLSNFISSIFGELKSSGILPISSLMNTLIAGILILIDYGMVLILSHIEPIINWVTQLLEALITWFGQFIDSLSEWVENLLNKLPKFLGDLILYINYPLGKVLDNIIEKIFRPAVHKIVQDAVRSLVESLASVASGFVFALGKIIENPFGDKKSMVLQGFSEGRVYGKLLAELNLGPAPKGKEPPPEKPGKAQIGEKNDSPSEPSINLGKLRKHPSKLLEVPPPKSYLEKILGNPQREPSLPPGVTLASTQQMGPEGISPITFNGGITVNISAQKIDRENVDETARLIAENVLKEIQRQTERDLFRRGLPTRNII